MFSEHHIRDDFPFVRHVMDACDATDGRHTKRHTHAHHRHRHKHRDKKVRPVCVVRKDMCASVNYRSSCAWSCYSFDPQNLYGITCAVVRVFGITCPGVRVFGITCTGARVFLNNTLTLQSRYSSKLLNQTRFYVTVGMFSCQGSFLRSRFRLMSYKTIVYL